MFIARIDVGRVGHLPKRSFELGPGLNLVFGRNEAGKSTARRAIEALLFPCEAKGLGELTAPLAASSFDATVHLCRTAKDALETITWRRKGTKLLDSDGRPLAPEVQAAWTWGTPLVDFRALYSLDGARLRDRAFLARKTRGSFGALVLELETGGRDLGALRERLLGELAELYVKRGHTRERGGHDRQDLQGDAEGRDTAHGGA
jgi:uncharacterized protein YhaN